MGDDITVSWSFDNTYLSLPESLYQRQRPTPVRSPRLILWNKSLAQDLALPTMDPQSIESIFSGNALPPGSDPIAQAYAGHQFGHFTKLGDGRALLLGELITPLEKRIDIQLKGSGRTAFSRGGDGRAALGPMLREYIISEAMFHLKIPTTRSLAVVATGETVRREQELPGAVLTRIAQSHIRVGTFEYVAALGDKNLLKQFTDYVINRHYPKCQGEDSALAFLSAVIEAQALLIAKWIAVGFVHGVMNTDNMAISGETIDYGPCAFLDEFDPQRAFSSIDRQGRYAFGNQISILQWNLTRFAETLLPLIHPESEQSIALAERVLGKIPERFEFYWLNEMRGKLGLVEAHTENLELAKGLLNLFAKHRVDYTNTFRALAENQALPENLVTDSDFIAWQSRWQSLLPSSSATHEVMRQHNPVLIPRNAWVERALQEAETGDLNFLNRLLKALQKPFERPPDLPEFHESPSPDPSYKTFCGT
jgi:uncharacterized protein YdiU (UPF0061 family)